MTGCQSERVFRQDVDFLRRHVDVIVLGTEPGGPRVAVVPTWQGRVVTSSATGENGTSYGWINYEHVQSGVVTPHINVFGGEDRFWIGPEGGQFAVFFKQGDPFEFDVWQTPALIDTEAYPVMEQTPTFVAFQRYATLTNYSGTTFDFRIDREVRLLDRAAAAEQLGFEPGQDAKLVAFETVNTLTNTGENAWTQAGGLLSIWILGMFKPSDLTTVVIPFHRGPVSERGPVVNDAYFGKVPADRLVVQDGVLFFSGDGRYRSKIGLGPGRATPLLGSYDAQRGVLTLVRYNQPGPEVTAYVNAMWQLQDDPYGGDVINSYNDGPLAGGGQLGPFYELETSSPAAALAPGESITHTHMTVHIAGSRAELDRIAQATLGVSLDRIEKALPH